jgi:hypothetical protein
VVQALAFAEIFLGLILADAGYKGVTLSAVVKGEAEGKTPNPLGASTTSGGATGSAGEEALPSPMSGSSLPTGFKSEKERLEAIQKNRAFGPSPEQSTSPLTGPQPFATGEVDRRQAFGPQPINSPNTLFGSAGAAP